MFFKEALIKWESTHCKPYTWRTILDVLSTPFVNHKVLADKIAKELRNRQETPASTPPVTTPTNTSPLPSICDGVKQTVSDQKLKETIMDDSDEGDTIDVDYKVARDMKRLKTRFSGLIYEVNKALKSENVSAEKLKSVLLEDNEQLAFADPDMLTIDSIFQKIKPSFCYINYTLLESIVNTFLTNTSMHTEFKQYSDDLEEFMESTTLHDLKQKVKKQVTKASKRNTVQLKLSKRWDSVTVKQFKHLISVMFYEKYLTHMTVTEGCLCVTWTITDTTSAIVTEWAYDTEFMKAIGVLYLIVEETIIYELETPEQEDISITLDKALLKVLESGPAISISAVELLLAVGSDPNLLLSSGDTAISRAAKIFNSSTVIYMACLRGHTNVVSLLLNAGADPSIAAENTCTPLFAASDNGHSEIVGLLINAKVDVHINAQANYGATALYTASLNGHLNVISTLLSANADPSIATNSGWTPLMAASHGGYNNIVELLIKTKIAVNAQNNVGITALYTSCYQGYFNICLELLRAGGDPFIASNNGTTPLMVAAHFRHIEIVELLISMNIDVNAQNKYGATALSYSCKNGWFKTTLTLLDANADPSIAMNDGWTPLMIASDKGHNEIVELLVNAKVNTSTQNSNGATALYIACQNGHLGTVLTLLDAKADPLIATSNGWTPLMIACETGQTETVELLMNFGIDVNFYNNGGDTALHAACQNKQFKIIYLLLNYHANPNIPRNDGAGWTPLMIASSMADIDTILLLLQYDADINYSTAAGETALSCASDDSVFQILLDCGADINMLQKQSYASWPLEKVPQQRRSHQQLPWTIEEPPHSIAHPFIQQEPKHDTNILEPDNNSYSRLFQK